MNAGVGFVLLGGMFLLAAISLHWEWFRNHYKVRYLVKGLGKTGATLFYTTCGLACVTVGVLIMAEIIKLE